MRVCSLALVLYAFIPIYRGVERRWEFSRYINLSCFEALILHPWSFAWFDSCPMKNLIQIHSITKGTTSAAMLLLSLSCYRDKDCRDGGCRVRGHTLHTMSFVNSGEVASGEICFWWRVFRSSSSDSFLQTHSSDAVLQTHFSRCFKLQIKFLCSWTCSIRIFMNSTFIMDPVHLNKLFSISNWLFLIPCYCQNSIGDLWNTLCSNIISHSSAIWILSIGCGRRRVLMEFKYDGKYL